MKGFIHLVEVAVAAILITIVLGAFLAAQSIKLSWDRSDLIDIGNNVFQVLDGNNKLMDILEDTSEIKKIKPGNIEFGLKVFGIPDSNITVGCVNFCSYAYDNILTPSFLNDRWINFTIRSFDIDAVSEIPTYYDAIILINYTGYSSQKNKILDYLDSGGVLIGINDTYTSGDDDFNEIYNLSAGSGSGTLVNFSEYDPSENEIAKYFLGIGMDVSTPYDVGGKKWGYWYIWENPVKVNSTPSYIEIEGIGSVPEDGKFNYRGYNFKVKKILWPSIVMIQALDTNFRFNDFSEDNVIGNRYNVLVGPAFTYAAMTTNEKAIWISSFSKSDEYRALVKAALASTVNDWYVEKPVFPGETATASFLKPMCCDMPEVAELTLILWYSY